MASAEGWIVLHSLGIAEHVRQVEGEADFTVIVPGAGILVIEVKSHRSVQRTPDGLWHLGSQPPTTRSPFQQAQEAMHSLRDYLVGRSIDLRLVPVCYAVWFTGARARAGLRDTKRPVAGSNQNARGAWSRPRRNQGVPDAGDLETS